MSEALATVDRFFRIIATAQDRGSDRLMQEWSYLYTLLKSEPVSFDRIDVYLSILQNHDAHTKRNMAKGKKSLTEHPKHKEFLAAVDEIGALIELGSGKIKGFD